jgi:hypothetical protein
MLWMNSEHIGSRWMKLAILWMKLNVVDEFVWMQRMITLIMCGCHIGHPQPTYVRPTTLVDATHPCLSGPQTPPYSMRS